jgi:hypothetical protein
MAGVKDGMVGSRLDLGRRTGKVPVLLVLVSF